MSYNSQKPIYLDYQSTTPVDPQVIKVMTESLTNNFGNPHSRTHEFGWVAEDEVEEARKNVAKVINADPKEIIFTSGATESNNLAIRGAAQYYKEKRNHILTLKTEHKCVIESVRSLKSEGFDVEFLPVQKNGIVDLDLLKSKITDKTLLVSVMTVNNEIGVIQPMKEIGKMCRENGVLFHTDAAQAFGKIPLDVEEMNIDMMSISGHKIYGPKGVGAIYIRRKPRVRVLPLIKGGGQERGIRSGTLSPALVAGLGEASKIALERMDEDNKKVSEFFDYFYERIIHDIPEIYLNGDKDQRYKGNLNISFGFIEGESMLMSIKEVAVSSGSACTSASLEPSYVLKALGVSEELAHTSIRFGFGRFTTREELDFTIEKVKSAIDNLRNLSPLWEMHQDGIDISKIQWGGHSHAANKESDSKAASS